MRTYVPATAPLLAGWHSAGLVEAETAFAVTPSLREWYASGDTEELEYAALSDAARASLRLLAADPVASRRRVVLAVDVVEAHPDAALGRSVVRLPQLPTFDTVVAVYIDGAEAEQAVAAAAAAAGVGDAWNERDRVHDGVAEAALEDVEAYELLWYATQEIPELIATR